VRLFEQYGVNPGRSGYDLCLVGGELIETTRKRLARFFGGGDGAHVVFANNASDALNLLIQGIAGPGGHAITTTLEHNSVIRPLNHLARDAGVRVDYIPYASEGMVDPDDIVRAFRDDTRLVVVNHGSNVIGTIQPVAEIGRRCRERGIRFVVDVAQTAGVVPIDMEAMCIDAVAFTGHKSLLAPTGIGGACIRDGVTVRQTRFGGTGVRSAHPYHLDEYPYRLEVGTVNVLGVMGLSEAQNWLEGRGIESIYRHEMELFRELQDGVTAIDGVQLHGTERIEERLPVLSLTVEGLDPSDVGTMLDVDFNIATRTGLQCAPLIHEQMGTAPRGTVRMSVGPATRAQDVETAVRAMQEIAVHVRSV